MVFLSNIAKMLVVDLPAIAYNVCGYAKLPEAKRRVIWVRAVLRPYRIAAVV
jgi:hypothetical protein